MNVESLQNWGFIEYSKQTIQFIKCTQLTVLMQVPCNAVFNDIDTVGLFFTYNKKVWNSFKIIIIIVIL